MRVPRVRSTIRSLMLAVLAAAGALCLPPLLLPLAFVLVNVVVEAGFRSGEILAAGRARRRGRESGRLARAVPPGPRR